MILVTGARGNIGGELVRLLKAKGERVRALSRDEAKARAVVGPEVEIAVGDFSAPQSLRGALAGVERAFFVADASPKLAELGGHFFDAAKASGVRQVVAVSSGTVAMDPPVAIGRWHLALEERLKASGLAWTILRPSGFDSNALRWAPSIKAQGKVFAAHGGGAGAPIDPRDIAAVAFHALTGAGHEGKTYALTGPQALSAKEQVALIGRAIGKELSLVEVGEDGARAGMVKGGMPEWMASAIVELVRAGARPGAGRVSNAVEEITGKPARSFETWARDHAAAFR